MAGEFRLSYTASDINEKLGKIDNLANKDEIPSKLSELTNDRSFATEEYVDNAIANIDIPEVDLSDYVQKSELPTKVSELENDSGYITSVPVTSVNGLVGDVVIEIPEQVQADWTQTDEAAKDYIKNKPKIATDEDLMDILSELKMVNPIVDSDGSILTSPTGKIYSL